MNLLLDTHTLLWALREPDRLSPTGRGLIKDPSNVVFVSAVSLFEIATKYRLGKLPSAAIVVNGFQAHLRTLRARELPISIEHGLRAGAFSVEHRDPFDRILAAQAVIEGLTLITMDPAFAQFEGVQTRW